MDSDGIIVLGAGGHGKSLISIMLADQQKIIGVLDDDPKTWHTKILDVPVLGSIELIEEYSKNKVCNGFGHNRKRKSLVQKYPLLKWTGFTSSLAYINPKAKIGVGSFIFPFAVVGAEVIIGDHAIISSHTTLGHDTIIGNYAQVAPGVQVAGDAIIEDEVMLGIGSIVCPKVSVGTGATLAAGAVAVKDIASGITVYGPPARPR